MTQFFAYMGLLVALATYAWVLGACIFKKKPLRYELLSVACTFQGLGLYAWSVHLGACPLYSAFEGYTFLSWVMSLLTLLLSPVWRFSAFTALGIGVSLFLGVLGFGVAGQKPLGLLAGFELHAALGLLAYSLFGLLALSAALGLLQDYALRNKRFMGFFSHLPPLAHSKQVRFLYAGCFLYASALLSAWKHYGTLHLSPLKSLVILGTFLGYLLLWLLGRRKGFWARPFCWGAIGLFGMQVAGLALYWR